MLNKTRAVSQIVQEILDRASAANPGDRAFLETAFSGYLASMAYAEIEKRVQAILEDRFSKVTDQKVNSFLLTTFAKGQGRITKADIADLAQKFGPMCKDQFNGEISDRSATYYVNMVSCRHRLTHGEPSAESLLTALNGIAAAEEFLTAFERAIT